jgi:nucleotide-binding universal stress UspA family protein
MKILVCYDGSEAGKKALDLAIDHAKAFDGELLAATALEGDPQEQLHHLEHAEQTLDYARVYLTAEGRQCETKLLSAKNLSAGENLVRFAEESKADVMIIGIKKTSKVGKLLTGSNAQHIILTASCPVISVK